MNKAKDRNALYYPYIRFRDENWLKASLLCFPQIRRIVSTGYPLRDSKLVQAFRDVSGPGNKPLLDEEDAYQ